MRVSMWERFILFKTGKKRRGREGWRGSREGARATTDDKIRYDLAHIAAKAVTLVCSSVNTYFFISLDLFSDSPPLPFPAEALSLVYPRPCALVENSLLLKLP